MNSKIIAKYKVEYPIGTKLRHCSGIGWLEYKIVGVRETINTIEFEVECQNCNDHNSCKILIAPNDCGNLVYVSMLNNDDEEEYGTDHQYIWHTTKEGYSYHKSLKDALLEYYKVFKGRKLQELEQAEKVVEDIKKWVEKADFDIENITNASKDEI